MSPAETTIRSRKSARAFSLVELVTVISIILVLAALVATLAPLLFDNSSRTRATGEIAGFSSAIERYKADQGEVPRGPASDALDPATGTPASYQAAGLELYIALSGDTNVDGLGSEEKSYFAFKPGTLMPNSGNAPITGISDPFGNSYGYSTLRHKQIEDQADTGTPPSKGHNPDYDLWSTGNARTASDQGMWITNW